MHLLLQTLCLEVWHHCPRSQAVAAALSQGSKGRPAEGPGLPRDVFLGSASAPLGTVLNRPQVGRCLKSEQAIVGKYRLSSQVLGGQVLAVVNRPQVGNRLHGPVDVQDVCSKGC